LHSEMNGPVKRCACRSVALGTAKRREGGVGPPPEENLEHPTSNAQWKKSSARSEPDQHYSFAPPEEERGAKAAARNS